MKNQKLKTEITARLDVLGHRLLNPKKSPYFIDEAVAIILSEILQGQLVFAPVPEGVHWFVRIAVPRFRLAPEQKEGEEEIWEVDPENTTIEYDCDVLDAEGGIGARVELVGTLYENTQPLPVDALTLYHVKEAVRHAERVQLLKAIPQTLQLKKWAVRKSKERARGASWLNLKDMPKDRLGNIISPKRLQQKPA